MFICIKMRNKTVCLTLVALEEMLNSFTLHYSNYIKDIKKKSSDT